jgi:hypothetical protein
MSNRIVLKKSSTIGKIPQASDLEYGELAINYADGKLYYKNSNNAIDEFVSSSATVAGVASIGGSTGAISTQQLLDFIKQVDGTGSGLDADTLDGTHASSFATLSGSETLTNKTLSNPTISYPVITGTVTANGTVGTSGQVLQSTGTGVEWITPTAGGVTSVDDNTGAITASQLLASIKTVDGAGSGLDADTLDGIQATVFVTKNGVETLINKTVLSPIIVGTVTANGTVGAAGQVLQSTGTGVQWVDPGTSTSTGDGINFNVLSRVGEIPIILTSILATYLNFDNQTFRTSVGLVDTRTTTITVTG